MQKMFDTQGYTWYDITIIIHKTEIEARFPSVACPGGLRRPIGPGVKGADAEGRTEPLPPCLDLRLTAACLSPHAVECYLHWQAWFCA